MTAEPTREPGADQPSAPTAPATGDAQPTFQTAASEAAAVAAKAVAEQVAVAAAARAAAAEEAAAREAAEATEAATAAEMASMAAANDALEAADVPTFEPAPWPGSDGVAIGSADAAPSVAAAMPAEPTDVSMAVTAPALTADGAAIPAAPETAPAATAPAAAAADATPKPSRRPVILAWTRRLAVFLVSVALLAGGVMVGSTTFQRARVASTQGAATEFTQAPADVAKEFITALAAGDSDAIRSSLSAQPNKDLTDEFSRFSIKKVTGVETLGTSVDGKRSATEVLLHTTNADGNSFDINLIILVNGNSIEGFR